MEAGGFPSEGLNRSRHVAYTLPDPFPTGFCMATWGFIAKEQGEGSVDGNFLKGSFRGQRGLAKLT